MSVAPIECRVVIGDETVQYSDDYQRKVPDGKILQDDLIQKAIRRIQEWVERHEAQCEGEDLELLGGLLYRLVFHGDVGEQFEASYDAFRTQKKQDQRLRLVLEFEERSRLASYPWEFLYSPRRRAFLAKTDMDLILTRFACPPRGELKPVDAPLRILVAFAQPAEEEQLDPGTLIDEIQQLARPGIIEVEIAEDPSYEGLRTLYKKRNYHVFHFIGHGKPGKIALMKSAEDLENEHVLARAEGRSPVQADWIDKQTVEEIFARHRPRLVFLHSCKGARMDSREGLKSTARQLAYANIPAVIAMQYEISNENARIFAEKFYEELGTGKPIDEAVMAARIELGARAPAWSHRRFGTPVLYLRDGSAIIEARGAGPDTSQPHKVCCPHDGCIGLVASNARVCRACGQEVESCPNPACSELVIPSDRRCNICRWGYGTKQERREGTTA